MNLGKNSGEISESVARVNCSIMNIDCWTGRSLPSWFTPVFPGLSREGRGKSELQRAMCQVTPGRPGSSPVDGKCHRENTACWKRQVRVKRCGKSAPAGQQCTAHGKPHTEQDQIGEKLRPSGLMRAGSVRR